MSFNLYYIRAAIQARTGQILSFGRIRQLLLEEGLISQRELDSNPLAKEFAGYGRFFYTEHNSVEVPLEPEKYLPNISFDTLLEKEEEQYTS
jgi:hypothetical protein|tara:strand:+ start:1722 stop:1997 length:276 start_codon:yes stop_codon:yes gene_type:complete